LELRNDIVGMPLIPQQAPEPQIKQIVLTEEERLSGVPDPLTLEDALAALHRDGR
jgi:hypothetical protein